VVVGTRARYPEDRTAPHAFNQADPIRRRVVVSVVLTVAAAMPALTTALAQETGANRTRDSQRYHVNGVVRDATREPLASVEITIVAGELTRGRTTTDREGRFDLGPFERGAYSLKVRRLGYQQRTIPMELGPPENATALDVVLLPVAEELDEVHVAASLPPSKLRGFYERSRQNRTFARFLTQDQIQKLSPGAASELLRTVPGVRLASNQSGGNVIRIRGCQPMVWVDDQRVPGAELDDLIVPSDIAAIEVYASSAGIPAQYLDRGNRLCGLILVWTKSG